MQTAIITVILAAFVALLICASYLLDRVVELEDRLEELGDG